MMGSDARKLRIETIALEKLEIAVKNGETWAIALAVGLRSEGQKTHVPQIISQDLSK